MNTIYTKIRTHGLVPFDYKSSLRSQRQETYDILAVSLYCSLASLRDWNSKNLGVVHQGGSHRGRDQDKVEPGFVGIKGLRYCHVTLNRDG